MQLRIQLALSTLAFATVAFAQNPITADSPSQVRYASNLDVADSVINITNTGANGNLCVNAYTFSPDEQLISCCSCPVTPNALASLSARTDLISKTLTPAVPTTIVIKLVATLATGACNAATVGTGTNAPVTGMIAWGTTVHALIPTPVPVCVSDCSPNATQDPGCMCSPVHGQLNCFHKVCSIETAFTPFTLSDAERVHITSLCGFIQSNGSGFGICKSCRNGGLGAVAQ
jgi:hypothetical protein